MRLATITSRPVGTTNNEEDTQSVESLMRIGRDVFEYAGIHVSQSKLSRMVRAYRRDVLARLDAAGGPVQTLDTYIRRTWTDLTGETAIRNVMTGGDQIS